MRAILPSVPFSSAKDLDHPYLAADNDKNNPEFTDPQAILHRIRRGQRFDIGMRTRAEWIVFECGNRCPYPFLDSMIKT